MKPGDTIVKKCNTCGKDHPRIPLNARKWIDEGRLLGFCWECECGSTMFKKVADLGRSIK